MDVRLIDAPDAHPASGGYAQAVGVTGVSQLLFISGQIPMTLDGAVPDGFAAQARLVWANVEAQLRAAAMTLDNLIKVTVFLSDRRYAEQNRDVRQEVLGERKTALTVIIIGIFDEAWFLEIEAVAAAG